MARSKVSQIFVQLLLTLWAAATLILVLFCAFLLYELFERGANPLPPADAGLARPVAAVEEEQAAPQGVVLYFADLEGRALVGEVRELDLTPHTQENCRLAVEALVEGPREAHTPVLPPSTEVRSVFLLDGELLIDFSAELRTDPTRPKSLAADSLMVYGVVNTMTQAALQGEDGAEVRRVRFLFEGLPLTSAFPEHFDLTLPVAPDETWLAEAAR
jgi:hypothetical protein